MKPFHLRSQCLVLVVRYLHRVDASASLVSGGLALKGLHLFPARLRIPACTPHYLCHHVVVMLDSHCVHLSISLNSKFGVSAPSFVITSITARSSIDVHIYPTSCATSYPRML